MSAKLPAWPEPKDYTFAPEMIDFNGVRHSGEPYLDVGLYQSALADAAMARLRVAVEALSVAQQAALESLHAQEVGPGWYTNGRAGMERQIVMWNGKAREAVGEALREIGPLPPLPPQTEERG